MKRTLALGLGLVLALFQSEAEAASKATVPVAASSQVRAAQPDTISIGTGWFDYFLHKTYRDDADIRLEHRWGLSLLSQADPSLASLDRTFQIHPMAGVETTPRHAVYGFGGFIFDVFLTDHLFFSPSLVAGLYSPGDSKRLGSILEFRSTAELGWRFDNGYRVSAYLSHMSNANLTRKNPGVEVLGGYIHIPFDDAF